MFGRVKIRGTICLLALAGTMAFISPAHSTSCALSPLTQKQKVYPVEIDYKARRIGVSQNYAFTEDAESGTATATRTATILFDDFNDIYKRFVQLRMVPKSKCDMLQPANFEITVDPKSGMVFASFFLAYEDKFCFPLRFYNPVNDPGVSKEPQAYQSGQDGFVVHNAFQPKAEGGILWIKMATGYSTDEGEKITKKLAEQPLENFLQDPSFFDFVQALILTGKFESWNRGKNMRIADARFIGDKDGKNTKLQITTQTTLPADNACTLHAQHTQSGEWK